MNNQETALDKLYEAKKEAERKHLLNASSEILMNPATRQEMAAFLPMGYMNYKEDEGERIQWLKVVIDYTMPDGELKIR